MVLVPVPHSHSKRHQAADPGADRGCASAVVHEEIVETVAGEVICNARTGDRRQHGWTCTYLLW